MTPALKMVSDESHFNVSLIVRDKVIRQCPQTTTFEDQGELKRIQTMVPSLPAERITSKPRALALGQTGSQGKMRVNAAF